MPDVVAAGGNANDEHRAFDRELVRRTAAAAHHLVVDHRARLGRPHHRERAARDVERADRLFLLAIGLGEGVERGFFVEPRAHEHHLVVAAVDVGAARAMQLPQDAATGADDDGDGVGLGLVTVEEGARSRVIAAAVARAAPAANQVRVCYEKGASFSGDVADVPHRDRQRIERFA